MNKVFAFTDIHGRYDLLKQILDYMDETDKAYFLGDAADRGPDGVKCIFTLLNDKRIIYLKGNHEDFFVSIGSEIIDKKYLNADLWRMNGGDKTIYDFENLDFFAQERLLSKLNLLPVHITYVNKNNQFIHLSHAGYNIETKPTNEKDFLWDRNHIVQRYWSKEEKYQNHYIVHGHTPIYYMHHKGGPILDLSNLKYCDNHKIDLDVACFSTGVIPLFNLDTLEVEKYFYDDNVNKEGDEKEDE